MLFSEFMKVAREPDPGECLYAWARSQEDDLRSRGIVLSYVEQQVFVQCLIMWWEDQLKWREDQQKFGEYLKRASAEVATWPEWVMGSILGRYNV